MAGSSCVVLIATPSGQPARKIAKALLSARLAACVQILPGIESHFWWEGKQRAGKETLLLVKTRRAHVGKLTAAVTAIHPYCTPEIVAVPVVAGFAPYLRWLHAETEVPRGKKH